MTDILNSTILVVDDDESNAILIEEYLRTFKLKVIRLNSALECLQTMKDIPEIRIIFLDIKMPGMDGIECLKEIRRLKEDVIVIAQTAYALNGDRERFLAEGFDDYLAKPIPRKDLTVVMEKFI
ncbi:MAG: response regulator [Bacteroidales bacterium]|nr:response regulator [Bacteroidales bacterium]